MNDGSVIGVDRRHLYLRAPWLTRECVCGVRIVCSLLPQADGWTPLHAASHAGHVEVVKELLVGGAAVNQAKVCWHLPSAVCRHIELGECDSVSSLVCMFDAKFGFVSVLPSMIVDL